MIDKQHFYHGAALIQLLDHSHCNSINKFRMGFIVNDKTYVFLKYTTKNRSPWRFTFSEDDISHVRNENRNNGNLFIVLICGGDGICTINIDEFNLLINEKAGWIAAKRSFHEQYSISGSNGELKNKISFKRWPQIIFDEL
jgi:hypothetical protein